MVVSRFQEHSHNTSIYQDSSLIFTDVQWPNQTIWLSSKKVWDPGSCDSLRGHYSKIYHIEYLYSILKIGSHILVRLRIGLLAIESRGFWQLIDRYISKGYKVWFRDTCIPLSASLNLQRNHILNISPLWIPYAFRCPPHILPVASGANAGALPLFQFFSHSKYLEGLLLYPGLISAINIQQFPIQHYKLASS